MGEKAFNRMKEIKFLVISERGWHSVVSGYVCSKWRLFEACRVGVSDLHSTNEVYR